jgi:hypothetical protein
MYENLFPPLSTGGRAFVRVADALTTINRHEQVDDLRTVIDARLNSQADRRQALAGVATAGADGFPAGGRRARSAGQGVVATMPRTVAATS